MNTTIRKQLNTRKGLFLVFDLDETIINTNIPVVLNENIVKILVRASSLRGKGVDAICLLTNNSDKLYISEVDTGLLKITGSVGRYGNLVDDDMPEKEYFFDYIASRNHPIRVKNTNNGNNKQILEFLRMAKKLGFNDIQEELMSRLYFFDDQIHILKSELKYLYNGNYANHYIQITPSFTGIGIDKTNYTPIINALDAITIGINGGSRKKRSYSKKRRTLRNAVSKY